MFGQFQQSNIRLEVKASRQTIQESLTNPALMRQWLWMQRWDKSMETLVPGAEFTTFLGVIPIHHKVDVVSDRGLRLLLSQGIDGYHEWSWDDGWLQSRLEGISLLPLNLGQTVSLLSLRHFVETQEAKK